MICGYKYACIPLMSQNAMFVKQVGGLSVSWSMDLVCHRCNKVAVSKLFTFLPGKVEQREAVIQKPNMFLNI